ncbi:MAG: SLC13 family permease [Bacteroidales bacterium]
MISGSGARGNKQFWGITAGIVLFCLMVLFAHPDPEKPEIGYTLAVTVLMALWWITEVIPLAVTSLLPVVLFPALGIMSGRQTAAVYFNDVIFLFLGGFMLAIALERWNLHRRIALKILQWTGHSFPRILLGFMLATAFLSMWISNTATAMMMVPIALSVVSHTGELLEEEQNRRLSVRLLLGVAYSASIGGIATLIGTPPNLAFAKIYEITFPEAPQITFGQWMIFATPLSAGFLILVWIYLSAGSRKAAAGISFSPAAIRRAWLELGPVSKQEKRVGVLFVLFALLLIFRSDISLGSFTLPGWSNLFPVPEYLGDGTIAVFISILLFIIPSGARPGETLLNWHEARQLPWRIVLLFGGGFALAGGFVETGLSQWIGSLLEGLREIHPVWIITSIVAVMIFLTEVTSNTATAQIILPITAALAVSLNIHPLLLMVPATVAGSMAFMLPVATPPNAIIFGSGKIRIVELARAGLILNLIGIVYITLIMLWFGSLVFGIDLGEAPSWLN